MFSASLNLSPRRVSAMLAAMLFCAMAAAAHATTVRLETTLGPIDIVLYEAAKPRTVAKFLASVNSGAYQDSFFDRVVTGAALQGGGYKWIEAEDAYMELAGTGSFDRDTGAELPNLRGTIALAATGTTGGGFGNTRPFQWIINLADNGVANLGGTNTAFTVFGEISPASMAVVDAIARLPQGGLPAPLEKLPVVGTLAETLHGRNLVLVKTAASAADYQGMWWNPDEPGWGMTLTQHGNYIFTTLSTYDENGGPAWYALPNCRLAGGACVSDIYRVSGAKSPIQVWSAVGVLVEKVGAGTLTFSASNRGTFSFTIDNKSGTKAIQPLLVAAAAKASTNYDYTDLWWSPAESGWGVTLSQQYNRIVASWNTFDATGKPVWLVAPDCIVGQYDVDPDLGYTPERALCPLYQTSGGSPLTSAWRANVKTEYVGTVAFAFRNALEGTMTYGLGAVKPTYFTREIRRQPF